MNECRQWILTGFDVRLDEMNAQQRRMGLPAVDAPRGLIAAERVAELRTLLGAIEADVARGQIPDRLLTNVGAHVLAWLDALTSGLPGETAFVEVPPHAPQGDPEFMPTGPSAA